MSHHLYPHIPTEWHKILLKKINVQVDINPIFQNTN